MTLLEKIVVVAELTGATFSKTALQAIEAELRCYAPDHVAVALERCQRELKHPVKLADILERIPAGQSGWPSADEAWSIAMAGQDEAETVITCDEIGMAYGEAAHILPDRTGARMAFKAVYERLVSIALAQERVPRWFGSFGSDKERKRLALEQAVQLRRIGNDYALKHLPPPDADPAVIAGLLEDMKPTVKGDKELANLKAMLGKRHLRLVKGAA